MGESFTRACFLGSRGLEGDVLLNDNKSGLCRDTVTGFLGFQQADSVVGWMDVRASVAMGWLAVPRRLMIVSLCDVGQPH